MGRKLLFATVISLVIGFSAMMGIAGYVGYQVYLGDRSILQKSTILARINEESSIYTHDGQKRIGSFFNSAHRSYVPIEQVPVHMVRAMVASEDKNFYNHVGVDPTAIISAFWDGARAGFRFRRGGSSITQQTVKNILDRREHTFKRKFKEMIRALQLEQMYSKNEILEFYLNQFHVTANGNGIGIAAKYYFSKGVADLDLVEAAFIAGSVKAPSKYNPFTKYTKKKRNLAWQRANERKNYVLKRMYTQGWIDAEEYREAANRSVPFKRGSFTSKEVALVSLIRGQLNKREILDALGLNSVADFNQAGMKVFTTIDADMQESAQLMMRRNLSRLQLVLKGIRAEDPKRFKPLRIVEENQFYFGRITAIKPGKLGSIEVDFGLPKGTIPYESIKRTAMILNLPTYKGPDFHIKEIFRTLKVGDVVLSEVKEFDQKNQHAVLELKAYPHLNGGLMAVDQGKVRAVVAGFEAQGFNRAVFATRQPGSVFKSLVFFAGLQLGWTPLDQVDNQRRAFPFQGNFYFPRPDHASPYDEVSMLWAGVKSENLGSIYLTAHLLDKLNFSQFKKLMAHLGLAPEKGETVSEYHYRVAKTVGVQLDTAGLKEYLLIKAIQDLKPDLVFSGHSTMFKELSRLHHGRGYLAEWNRLYEVPEEDLSVRERGRRIALLKFNHARVTRLAEEMTRDWQLIAESIRELGFYEAMSDPDVRAATAHFRVLDGPSGVPQLSYDRLLPEEGELLAEKWEESLYAHEPQGRALNNLDLQTIWAQGGGAFGEVVQVGRHEVRLAGILPMRYLEQIDSHLQQRLDAVVNVRDNYGQYRYYNHHDFRIVLGLTYLQKLSKAMGIYSKIEPVLSFPLGTNVVSVAEVAKIYQTFVDGKTYRFFEKGPENQLSFIKHIEDRDGNILYEPEVVEHQLVDRCIAQGVGEILRRVVTHGTGRRARGELQLSLADSPTIAGQQEDAEEVKIRVPAYGKTGTTNDYTTAYFAGFVPYPTVRRAPLAPENSLVIASYVGYDLNATMRNGPFRVTGAHGALPVWSDFARAMLDSKRYVDFIDHLDISLLKKRVWELSHERCGTPIPVDLARGTVIGGFKSRQEEVFSPTNIELEGEVLFNEFERNSSVRSTVSLPVTKGTQGMVERYFKLFKPLSVEEEPELDEGALENEPEFHEDEGYAPEEGEYLEDESGAVEDELNPQAPIIGDQRDAGYVEEEIW